MLFILQSVVIFRAAPPLNLVNLFSSLASISEPPSLCRWSSDLISPAEANGTCVSCSGRHVAIFLTVTLMAMLSLLGLYLILLKARVGLEGPQGRSFCPRSRWHAENHVFFF